MERRRGRVEGVAQGVGFRPFAARLARELGLAGGVRNEGGAVVVEVEGDRERLDAFARRLEAEAPAAARIDRVAWAAVAPRGARGFRIDESDPGGAPRLTIPPDLRACEGCLAEVEDPGARRLGYPFTSCAACGPRFTIVEALPYDRPRTTMARFAMCAACRREYDDPADRRYHAQPIACPACGPALTLRDAAFARLAGGDAALAQACEALRRGGIVALKGLGGYQLLCDARDEAAVQRLRERKRRAEKPFAVMVAEVAAARALAAVSALEEEALTSAAAPIVLLRRRGDGLARSVAPGSARLGVMLPATPLHHLLARRLGFPVVATSGNLHEEPIAADDEDARRRLGRIADVFLTHDRPIARRCDDAVVHVVDGRIRTLRLARGLAPVRVALGSTSVGTTSTSVGTTSTSVGTTSTSVGTVGTTSTSVGTTTSTSVGTVGATSTSVGTTSTSVGATSTSVGTTSTSVGATTSTSVGATSTSVGTTSTSVGRALLCAGAHLKNAPAAAVDGEAVLWPHVGDLDTPAARDALDEALAALRAFLALDPAAVVADAHPDYASTRWAERSGLPVVRVQHHHAHVAACLAEHGGREALGVAWDGAGLGDDGTLWGGELLHVTPRGARRLAHLRPFPLPGGDAAARDGRRALAGLLVEAGLPLPAGDRDLERFAAVARSTRLAPRTSSAGRLFDAVAALTGLRARASFEGQAALAVEHAAEPGAEPYPFRLDGPSIDWAPMLAPMLAERGDARRVASRFHATLIAMIVEVAVRHGARAVALAGGCFQNVLLAEGAARALRERGLSVLLPAAAPPGDGGLALGQAWVASHLASLPRSGR
ncbi:hydrogenase maturation protein HypF [Sorangium cellulosum]|uniref:Carbamoyltransferase n=1 Tax=Sorangium cellulosum TaxID=56 RepID=A0A4P2Q4D0_SORCE|nr:carbamoyltransferase HypF [Sorangium cellulosum]AUX24244.1 hydrogenase maturation protein HypF [Sorangium cellulosum]